MTPRFLENSRQEAAQRSEDAMLRLAHQMSPADRKTVSGLQRGAALTRLAALRMDAVA